MVLGLATAVGILALVQPKLVNAPLLALLQSWAEISHAFWNFVGEFFALRIPRPIAASLSVIAVCIIMLIRAAALGYIVPSPLTARELTAPFTGKFYDFVKQTFGWVFGFLLVLFVAFFVTVLAVENGLRREAEQQAKERGLDYYDVLWPLRDEAFAVAIATTVVAGFLLATLFWRAPRAFWGAVIATIALVGVGMLRIPPLTG
jgi:hypothetical protein